MNIWEKLVEPSIWKQYYEYKVEKRHLSKYEEKELLAYIEKQEYLAVMERWERDELPLPEKKQIRKMQTEKKREVYVYPRKDNQLLKLMTYLLLREYDSIFSDHLYSFRTRTGVRQAMKSIQAMPNLSQKYTFKLDISNYFNSIPVEEMLRRLAPVLAGDNEKVYALFEKLLLEQRYYELGKICEGPKGVMAGSPFAVFMANVYLLELDKRMEEEFPFYARYSDDIIVFADSEEDVRRAEAMIKKELATSGLRVNAKKEVRTAPGEPWSFLGMKYCEGTIDISDISREKLKNKMRRRARAIKRWQIRKGATNEQAAKAFIRAMNRKFFAMEDSDSHDLTWSRWYFPIINTDKTLHELDLYMQEWIRYLITGKHNKGTYRFRYEDMKKFGYQSLVNAWYKKEYQLK